MMDRFSSDPFDAAALSTDVLGQRSTQRDSLLLTAQFRLAGESESEQVRVRNLSAGGLMAEVTRPLSIGDKVEVDVRGVGWISGKIAWSAAGRVGVAFDYQIDPKAARKPVGKGAHTPYYAKAPVVPRS